MELLNISIFLDGKCLQQLRNLVTNNVEIIEDFIITENEAKIECFQIVVSDIVFIFLPANLYHEHLDFEIGIAISDVTKEWNRIIRKFNTNNILYKFQQMENNKYIVIDKIHGPFFFIKSDRHSLIDNILSTDILVANDDYKTVLKVLNIISGSFEKIINIYRNRNYRFESVKIKRKQEKIHSFVSKAICCRAEDDFITIYAKE